MDHKAQELLDFWIGDVGPDGWYAADDARDATIRDGWGDLWETARGGGLANWRSGPKTCLALAILLDQFPRNMFRDDPRAFATDALARAAVKIAILHGQDRQVGLPERQFFYTPLMHSELQTDQDRSVRLFLVNFGAGDDLMLHARAHREAIRRFGRFPARNAALGRESTPEEKAHLEAGGYRAMLTELAG